MKKIAMEIIFFLLSIVSFMLCLRSLPVHQDRAVDVGLDQELRIQKENHINARRKLRLNEMADHADNNTKEETGDKGAKGEEEPEQNPKKKQREQETEADTEQAKEAPKLIIRAKDGSLVDLNTATAEELEKIKGIGPKLAEKIVVYRKEKGVFLTQDDLLNVKGIGSKKLNQIKMNGVLK